MTIVLQSSQPCEKLQQLSGQLHNSTAGTSAASQTYTYQGISFCQISCIISLPHFFTSFFVSSRPHWISTYCKHTGVTSGHTLFVQLPFTTFPFLACTSSFLILISAWFTKWHLQFASSGKSKYPASANTNKHCGLLWALQWLQLLFKDTVGLLSLQRLSSSLWILKGFIYTKRATFPAKKNSVKMVPQGVLNF